MTINGWGLHGAEASLRGATVGLNESRIMEKDAIIRAQAAKLAVIRDLCLTLQFTEIAMSRTILDILNGR